MNRNGNAYNGRQRHYTRYYRIGFVPGFSPHSTVTVVVDRLRPSNNFQKKNLTEFVCLRRVYREQVRVGKYNGKRMHDKEFSFANVNGIRKSFPKEYMRSNANGLRNFFDDGKGALVQTVLLPANRSICKRKKRKPSIQPEQGEERARRIDFVL